MEQYDFSRCVSSSPYGCYACVFIFYSKPSVFSRWWLGSPGQRAVKWMCVFYAYSPQTSTDCCLYCDSGYSTALCLLIFSYWKYGTYCCCFDSWWKLVTMCVCKLLARAEVAYCTQNHLVILLNVYNARIYCATFKVFCFYITYKTNYEETRIL